MNIKCTNLGIIQEADITIDGITVIAGENDTGKSTISKMMFLLYNILDIRNIESYKERLRKKEIQKSVSLVRPSNNSSTMRVLNRAVHFNPYISKLLEDLSVTCDDSKINDILLSIESRLKEHLHEEGIKYEESQINKFIDKINNASKKKYSSDEIVSLLLKRYLKSLFDDDICNKYTDEPTSVKLIDNGVSLIDLSLRGNKISNIEYLFNAGLETVTYIETPLILQYSSMIAKARTVLETDELYPVFLDVAQVDVISKDLINKLITPFGIQDESKNVIIKNISSIIKGNVKYDDSSSSFIYDKDGIVYNIKNTASGIKTFGILQVLVEKGFIGENSLLILDEPEVNVHPKWQIKYAELIVNLVKSLNVKVLINSHSPYFIEAIQIISQHENINNRVNFYETKKCSKSKLTKIVKINDIDSIFASLSEPFDMLDEIKLTDF